MSIGQNQELYILRKEAHLFFGQLWKTKYQRAKAYAWLASKMGLSQSDCHFSLFTKEQCQEAVKLIRELKPTIEDTDTNRKRFERRKII